MRRSLFAIPILLATAAVVAPGCVTAPANEAPAPAPAPSVEATADDPVIGTPVLLQQNNIQLDLVLDETQTDATELLEDGIFFASPSDELIASMKEGDVLAGQELDVLQKVRTITRFEVDGKPALLVTTEAAKLTDYVEDATFEAAWRVRCGWCESAARRAREAAERAARAIRDAARRAAEAARRAAENARRWAAEAARRAAEAVRRAAEAARRRAAELARAAAEAVRRAAEAARRTAAEIARRAAEAARRLRDAAARAAAEVARRVKEAAERAKREAERIARAVAEAARRAAEFARRKAEELARAAKAALEAAARKARELARAAAEAAKKLAAEIAAKAKAAAELAIRLAKEAAEKLKKLLDLHKDWDIKVGHTFSFSFAGTDLYNEGGIRLWFSKGSFSFRPEIELAGRVGIRCLPTGGLCRLKAVASGEFGAEVELSAHAEKTFTLNKSRQLWAAPPIRIPMGPIWADAVLSLSAGIEANANASVDAQAGATANARVAIGGELDGFNFHLIKDASFSFKPLGPSYTVKGSFGGRAYIRPELTIKIVSLAGPYFGVEPYAKVGGVICPQPSTWSIDAGIKAVGGFKLDLGISLGPIKIGVKKEWGPFTLYDFEKNLARGSFDSILPAFFCGGGTPPPPNNGECNTANNAGSNLGSEPDDCENVGDPADETADPADPAAAP